MGTVEVSLHEATTEDLRWVEAAVVACPAAMAEFGGFYARACELLAPLLGPDRSLLVVRRDGVRVGFLDVDCADEAGGTLALTWFVVPHERGRHLAATAIAQLRALRPGCPVEAAVDPDNVASLATARRAGLVDIGADRWGLRVVVGGPTDPT